MNPNTPKVPCRPPPTLKFRDEDFVEWTYPLFRLHRVFGRHPSRWNEFRTFGPITNCRWDPHPEPAGECPERGVLYAAGDPTTALAEFFQAHRMIRLTDSVMITGWKPTRPLRLLDMSTNWPIRNKAGRALSHAPRSTSRAWARAIIAQVPDNDDGLVSDSTLTGRPSSAFALWPTSANSFPTDPEMSLPLDSPALSAVIAKAAEEINYAIGVAN